MSTQSTAAIQTLRSPICVVVGHVDHGKSSVLDYIRSSNIVATEAGAITQAIGASLIPMDIIRQKCGGLLNSMKMNFSIPGLLFIDTPGHAAFTSLRQRGGSLADIAVVVIDIEEGCMPQTIESIKILKEYKTPFLVAVNKIDRINGYRACKMTQATSILGNIAKQDPHYIEAFETKMYRIVQQLSEIGFPSERFDRVSDFTKEIALVPTCAVLGDGMGELLMVLSALAQKYLESQLQTSLDGPARGTILEVKEQKGVGIVLDTIIFDGTLSVNDTIVIGDLAGPVVTKVRALFAPTTIVDMRDKKSKFGSIQKAVAATGVRIVAPGVDHILAGMPIYGCAPSDVESVKREIMEQISQNRITTSERGVVIKADTIGSLEAMVVLCAQEGIPVRIAGVGNVSKKDLLEAQSNAANDSSHACILGFNISCDIPVPADIKVITAPVIYRIIDQYKEWKKAIDDAKMKASRAGLPQLAKFRFMPGYAFRANNPAVVGIHVLAGNVVPNMQLIKTDGTRCGYVKGLQHEKESIQTATKDMQVACSIDGVTVGRQLLEGDTLFTSIDEELFLRLKEAKDLLTLEEKDILREIADIMRVKNPVWGMGG